MKLGWKNIKQCQLTFGKAILFTYDHNVRPRIPTSPKYTKVRIPNTYFKDQYKIMINQKKVLSNIFEND